MNKGKNDCKDNINKCYQNVGVQLFPELMLHVLSALTHGQPLDKVVIGVLVIGNLSELIAKVL